jgi:hypothetical protein
MIETAACATQGVKIPGQKQTRSAIVKTFKTQMKALSERLNDVCKFSLVVFGTDWPL